MTGPGQPDFLGSDFAKPGIEIVDMGLLAEGDLARVLAAATVLVNPRPLDSQDSCMNFPSKVLDYLAYERPIVSTRAPGIGPDYDGVLEFAESDSPASIASAIDRVLAWPPSRQAEVIDRIRTFNAAFTPLSSASRFLEWLKTVAEPLRVIS